MAEKFQPQTFDINAINEGDKFTLGDGISPEAVNAPIEAAAYIQSLATNQPNIENIVGVGDPSVSIELAPNGTPRFKFESLQADNSQEIQELQEKIAVLEEDSEFYNTEINELWGQVENHADKIEANKKELHNIKQALLQNEVLVVSKIPNKTTTRITAGGENIVDEQYSPVLEIKGSTVQTINLIPYPYGFTTYTVNGITYTAQNDGSVKVTGTATGTAIRTLNTTTCRTNIASLNGAATTGGGFTISGGKDGVVVAINKSDGMAYMYVEKNETVDTVIYPMLVKGVYTSETMPSYISYFSDLKHAYIKAIKSTGRNLFDLNLLGSWIKKDSTDENYFVFIGGTTDLFKLFEEPKNIYAKIKYKAYDTTRPANERGAFPKFIKNDGTYYELSTYLNRDGESNAYIENVVGMKFTFGSYHKNTIGEFIISFEDVPFEPYTEEIYQLPETLELGEYDRFNPQTGEIVIQTGYATSETGFTEEEIAGYDSAIVSSDNRSLEYKLATPTIEKIENAQKLYKAWNKGSETVVQGETDNSIYGAMPTITNEYILKIGGEE